MSCSMNGINESIGRTHGETNTMLRYAPKRTEDQFSTESTPLLVPRVRSADFNPTVPSEPRGF